MSSYESDESADAEAAIACNPCVEKWLSMEEKGKKARKRWGGQRENASFCGSRSY
jgi:hypothetical protein